MRIAPDVAEALAAGRAVVALESTIISHGLPRPRNLEIARKVEAELIGQPDVQASRGQTLGSLVGKLGVNDRAAAVAAGYERGLLGRAPHPK